MALSLSDIIEVSAPAVIHEFRRDYRITRPAQLASAAGYYFNMYDNQGITTSIQWSIADEIRVVSERERIAFARSLLEYGIRSLDDFIARRNEVEAIIDVEFNA